jgi:hypothetical protein
VALTKKNLANITSVKQTDRKDNRRHGKRVILLIELLADGKCERNRGGISRWEAYAAKTFHAQRNLSDDARDIGQFNDNGANWSIIKLLIVHPLRWPLTE